MSVEQVQGEARFTVRNIGGIEETSVTFSPGVTILAGRNATNRTSLLRAVMAACGSYNVSLKGDADEGFVELEFNGETYTRKLTRMNGSVTFSGDPYLDDPTLANLFAFLLESNEARRTIATNDDLRELIMRPVDTNEIEAEIDRLVNERQQLDDDLDEIESLKADLPDLEAERTRLTEQIEEKQAELREVEAALEAADADVEETREEKADVEDALEELREKRSTLEEVRYQLETERESLEALRKERTDLESEKKELPETPVGELNEIKAEIDRLRTQKQQIESEISELQSIIKFNEDMLEETDHEVLQALAEDDAGGDITEQLVESETVRCWTCGSEVERTTIETTVDRLRTLSQEKLGQTTDIQAELDELITERQHLQDQQRRREQVERRLEQIDDQIAETETTLERLQDRRETLTDEIADIEEEVEAREDDAYDEILELHKEANQLEYELGRLEKDRDDVEAEITRVEDRIAEQDDLEAERAAVQEEIETLRTKIGRLEKQSIEAFNDHMESVLDRLDYQNLDRIWLERVERAVQEGRRTVTKSSFELHVIRSTDTGTTYEDTVKHLSESEREVTGLVFALAGYLAHDVHDHIPFMVLDSLEAIDSERIAALIDYLEDFPDFLVVALLPEDAEAMADHYQYLTEI